jgi:hypothetical protein
MDRRSDWSARAASAGFCGIAAGLRRMDNAPTRNRVAHAMAAA